MEHMEHFDDPISAADHHMPSAVAIVQASLLPNGQVNVLWGPKGTNELVLRGLIDKLRSAYDAATRQDQPVDAPRITPANGLIPRRPM